MRGHEKTIYEEGTKKLGILGVLLLFFLIWTLWGNKALMVNMIMISGSRVPAGFSGFRIAQVSDLHNDVFGKNNVKLLDLLQESTPDIIVITGDYWRFGSSKPGILSPI